jgi:hypothetical protein
MARQAADAVFVPANELMGMRKNNAAAGESSLPKPWPASVLMPNEELLESEFALPIVKGTAATAMVS